MNKRQPPPIATWILEHLTPGQPNNALQGDLLEDFQNGRTSGWYWRQVISALAVACSQEVRAHWLTIAFALTWTIATRVYWHLAFWPATHAAASMLPWPYSPIAGTSAIVLESLWFGLALYGWLYTLLQKTRAIDGFPRGFWISPPLYFALCIIVKIVAHPLGMRVSNLDALHPVLYCLSFATAAWSVKIAELTPTT